MFRQVWLVYRPLWLSIYCIEKFWKAHWLKNIPKFIETLPLSLSVLQFVKVGTRNQTCKLTLSPLRPGRPWGPGSPFKPWGDTKNKNQFNHRVQLLTASWQDNLGENLSSQQTMHQFDFPQVRNSAGSCSSNHIVKIMSVKHSSLSHWWREWVF